MQPRSNRAVRIDPARAWWAAFLSFLLAVSQLIFPSNAVAARDVVAVGTLHAEADTEMTATQDGIFEAEKGDGAAVKKGDVIGYLRVAGAKPIPVKATAAGWLGKMRPNSAKLISTDKIGTIFSNRSVAARFGVRGNEMSCLKKGLRVEAKLINKEEVVRGRLTQKIADSPGRGQFGTWEASFDHPGDAFKPGAVVKVRIPVSDRCGEDAGR